MFDCRLNVIPLIKMIWDSVLHQNTIGGFNTMCYFPRRRGIKGVESSKAFIIIKICSCNQVFCNGGFLISVLSSPPPVPSEPPPPAEDNRAIITIHPVNPLILRIPVLKENKEHPPPLIPPSMGIRRICHNINGLQGCIILLPSVFSCFLPWGRIEEGVVLFNLNRRLKICIIPQFYRWKLCFVLCAMSPAGGGLRGWSLSRL